MSSLTSEHRPAPAARAAGCSPALLPALEPALHQLRYVCRSCHYTHPMSCFLDTVLYKSVTSVIKKVLLQLKSCKILVFKTVLWLHTYVGRISHDITFALDSQRCLRRSGTWHVLVFFGHISHAFENLSCGAFLSRCVPLGAWPC